MSAAQDAVRKSSSAASADYRLTSVTKSEPPDGAEGGNWHRYELARGGAVITGYRQGTMKEVTRVAEEIVRGLNERRFPRKGRVQLTRSRRSN
ncbi:MAG: hypothetical protein EA371_10435 [Gammaproteobacteria bacterium]|nr:MAG: hypothetical protein EA371_10435 [Gammaproteobacteria bacterium]